MVAVSVEELEAVKRSGQLIFKLLVDETVTSFLLLLLPI